MGRWRCQATPGEEAEPNGGGVFVSGGRHTAKADLGDRLGGNPWMWPGRSCGPALFQGPAWREHGDIGRDGDSNVRYYNLHGFNVLRPGGLEWVPNPTLTGGGYQRRPLEGISLDLA
jgi:hypothetical protein